MNRLTEEFRENWKKDCLKTLCAFANANGGTMKICIKNNGTAAGVRETQKLLSKIPTEIYEELGFIAKVDCIEENGIHLISIKVGEEVFPVSFDKRYYTRSGCVDFLMDGDVLSTFLLRKRGTSWDAGFIPGIRIDDLDEGSFESFRKKAILSKQLKPQTSAMLDNEHLFTNLYLKVGEHITRAGALLFHKNPGLWLLGSHIEIERIGNDSKIFFKDEVGGPLMNITDRLFDRLYPKYLTACDEVLGKSVPREAMREAVMNALAHKNYRDCTPIKIKVYDDRAVVCNACLIPPEIEPLDVVRNNRSILLNLRLAYAIERSGQMYGFGTGIARMKKSCLNASLPEPEFEVTSTSFSVSFGFRENNVAEKAISSDTELNAP